ncbi:hypothetical protein RJ639_023869 [Escallonia herrerae]|uniref:Uncharacterized protein n=1 Tax=Escallonia herrerae TaxID=1293975 RepID=A0AA89ADZ6_9ASTE|nr:hypothetical protein RJ639_023869 [Escallonia herrerae]
MASMAKKMTVLSFMVLFLVLTTMAREAPSTDKHGDSTTSLFVSAKPTEASVNMANPDWVPDPPCNCRINKVLPLKGVREPLSPSQHSVPRRDALGDIKDEAEDKFDEDTWFTLEEKRNKMTKEDIIELCGEFPLPPPFYAQVLALQEPANYGTDLETSVYEGQIKSGYRIPMHPFVVAFFNYNKIEPGQLVPNGRRKIIDPIYLVQTSGYPVTVDDFMRLYLEVCFIKNVARSVGWYYIHNRVRVIKGGPKSDKGSFPRNGTDFVKTLNRKAF